MKERNSLRLSPCILNIGSFAVYCSICVSIILYCKGHSAVSQRSGQDLAKVLLTSLANSVTIILGLADIAVAAILLWQKKEISKSKVAIFTITFFVFVYFNVVALKYPLSVYWIVFFDGFLFALCSSYSFLWGTEELIEGYTKNRRLLGSITHKKIIAEQLFSYKRIEKSEYVIYNVKSEDHVFRSDHDINGILSVTYRLPRQDDTTFSFIRDSYQSLVNDGNDDTRKELIKTLKNQKNDLTERLKKISSPDDVTQDDCCLARVLMIYLAFLRILDSPSEDPAAQEQKTNNSGWYGGESYIGELSLQEGQIGLNVEVEQRLFTLLRTGLLGAILVGHKSRYIFSYKKSGYKVGRRYSATILPDSDNNPTNKICMFTLTEILTKSIPMYITAAIQDHENRVIKTLHKMQRGEL